ncbi:MAG: hypothetical protein Fur009_4960 [Candidatus Microgenomates bacterium]
MKKLGFFLGFLIILLVIFNLFFFFLSIKLSDEITYYESKIEKIHHENVNLEKKLSEISSLEYAQKIAKNLDINKKAQVIYLENLKYAFLSNQ